MIYADFRIKAQCKEDMVSLMRLFAVIQHAGEVGTCKSLNVVVDGDGSGHYEFQLKENGKFHDIPSVERDDKKPIWLGE